MTRIHEQLAALADYLQTRRGPILDAWQSAVAADPELTTASSISHAQFNDHIPQLLDAFDHRLRSRDRSDTSQARAEQRASAAEHGLQRWQQGYDQRETMREWSHLHLSLLGELEHYAQAHPDLESTVMPAARAALVRLCAEGVCESANRYTRLQQQEAAGRVRELELALQELQSLERQRAEVWRVAAHDLRGSVGVISNATAILSRENLPDPARAQFSRVLQSSVSGLRELLGDLMDLARLEAGQEQRRVVPFDVAMMVKDFSEPLREVASARNLFLKTEGPSPLLVEGDPVKVQRIARNLVLNALKATTRGGVRLTWQEREVSGTQQWILCVQDTGPGFDAARAAPLQQALKRATDEGHDIDQQAQSGADGLSGSEPAPAPAATLASDTDALPAAPLDGEGIGLSIVKRLCELLDASLELESAAGAGTTFRVVFPRRYGRGR